LKKALGKMPMPENAWDLVFDPKYTSKLKSCGIAYLDSPTEIIPVALHYIGKDAYSNDPADYKAATDMLAKVRKDVRLFSSTMIDDIAGGKACVAIGWSGDINIAAGRAKENKAKYEIEALLPSTGALIFFDTMAITKDAKHPNNAACVHRLLPACRKCCRHGQRHELPDRQQGGDGQDQARDRRQQDDLRRVRLFRQDDPAEQLHQ
jgi:putrescine transport system substrate-binding protein